MVLNNRYELLRVLGSGGIGVVYEARDRVLGESVALKVLHPHLRDEPAVLDAFRREVAISRLVDHPSVARIHDMGADPVTRDVYLAMEYLGGGDLKTRIVTRGPRDPAETRGIAAAVLGALGAAHERGVVHRDVKPHNILFDAQGKPRLGDFGLARCGELLGLDESRRVVGTPEYLAPESAESGYADTRSDLYSLGIVLYETATGRLPFEARTAYEMLRKQATADSPAIPPDAPGFDPVLARVVHRLMEKDPSRRYQTADDAAAALEAGSPRVEPAPVPDHPCPICGAPVPDAFPYCFACRREPVYATRAPQGADRHRVLVTGPGKPGDQISQPARSRCLDLVRDLDVDPRRLARRLPRLPFVLARGMDREGAARLVEALGAQGLEAEAAPERWRGPSPRTRSLVRRKDAILSARLVGIMLASMGGTLGPQLGRLGQAGWVALVGILVAVFGAAVVGTIVRHRLPEVIWKPGAGPGRAQAIDRYLRLAPLLSSPALQALARRIIVRYEELERLTGDPETARAAAPLVLQAADWIEACEALEERLGREDERGLYRRLADLRIAPGVTDGEDRERYARSLDARRNLERTRGVLLERLLSFSARLDRLLVSLGSRSARETGGHLVELERLAEEASLTVSSIGEVDRDVGRSPG